MLSANYRFFRFNAQHISATLLRDGRLLRFVRDESGDYLLTLMMFFFISHKNPASADREALKKVEYPSSRNLKQGGTVIRKAFSQ